MTAIKLWLLAGSPAHWIQLLALVAYAGIEWVLPRTRLVKANSIVEALANLLKPVLGKVPLVARVVALLATPEAHGLLCETGGTNASTAKYPRESGHIELIVLLLLASVALIGMCMSFSGCTPAGKAWTRCELNALPTTAETVIADVISIALNPASVVADLEDLAIKDGPTQVACASAAYQAYLATKVPKGAKFTVQAETAIDTHAISVLGQFLAKHPAQACRGGAAL